MGLVGNFEKFPGVKFCFLLKLQACKATNLNIQCFFFFFSKKCPQPAPSDYAVYDIEFSLDGIPSLISGQLELSYPS